MRKLKFRGIATVNDKHNGIKVGDFVYGCFVETNIDCQILFGDGEQVSVDRKTVGQYTGLTDKNGVEIYEGDIIEDDEHYYSVISWDNENSMFVASDVGGMEDLCWPIKAIGNIHQNPELLGEQNENLQNVPRS